MESLRLKLQNKLEDILGSRNVYFQPPESLKMQYPAIRYKLKSIKSLKANDSNYLFNECYEIIFISPRKDDNMAYEILNSLNYISMDRFYVSDNLNHYVFTLYLRSGGNVNEQIRMG